MVGRLGNASLWLIAPYYAAWRGGKFKVSRPLEPFLRWKPKELRWQIPLLVPGVVTIAVAMRVGNPGWAIFGAIWAFLAGFRLIARLLVPRRWVEAETDFILMTGGTVPIRAVLWVGFAASLGLANWTVAVACGLAATLLTLEGAIVLLVVQRVVARRRVTGP